MAELTAFGGGPLVGHKLMRIAYMDESGTSDREPIAVVAAVMLHADSQWRPLNQALSDMADACAPPAHRSGFIFHAKELYHGGKTLLRELFPPEYGRGFLKSILRLPNANDMPVVMGFVVKSEMTPDYRPDAVLERNTLYHTIAFIEALVSVDRVMREYYSDELCQVVVEDHQNARAAIREAFNFLHSPASATLPADILDQLPLRHIINPVAFAQKYEASPLQVADASAFTIRRYMENLEDASDYYDILLPAMMTVPKRGLAHPLSVEG